MCSCVRPNSRYTVPAKLSSEGVHRLEAPRAVLPEKLDSCQRECVVLDDQSRKPISRTPPADGRRSADENVVTPRTTVSLQSLDDMLFAHGVGSGLTKLHAPD